MKNSLTSHHIRSSNTQTVIEILKERLGPKGLKGMISDSTGDDVDGDDENKEDGDDSSEVQKLQKEANEKRAKRAPVFGNLLRSKGFAWVASTHDMIGAFSQVGSTRLFASIMLARFCQSVLALLCLCYETLTLAFLLYLHFTRLETQ
jgi:G3E family GTPase